MTTATLPRMTFGELDVEDARVGLAKAAKSTLGYNRLARAISVPDALMFKLRELGIEPFTKQSVEEYKAKKEYRGMYSGTKATLRWFAACVFGFAMMSAAFPQHPTSFWISWAVGFGVIGFIGMIGSIAWAGDDEWGAGNRTIRSWRTISIAVYSTIGSVPEFALERAVKIKTACPQASIGVDYLIEEQENREKPLRDPFMYVELGDERYYVDVWDEKEYEAKLY